MSLKIRRGLEVDRVTFTPAQGELLYTTDEKRLYIGDGTTNGGNPVGGGDLVTETVATQFVHNEHTNISFTYNNLTQRILGTVPGIQVAGDDSTVRTVNLGETIQYVGTGGTSVTTDLEGKVTIDSITYNIEARTETGGAALRLQSTLSADDVKFVGGGGTTVTRTDANTITISSGMGGGGSGTINAGLVNQLSFYQTAGTTLSGTTGLTYDNITGILSCPTIDANLFINDTNNFAIISTNPSPNNLVSFGGTYLGTEYDSQVVINDFQTATGVTAPFTINAIHSGFPTNGIALRRANGTLANPTSVSAGESLGAITFLGYDGTAYRQSAIIAGGTDAVPYVGAVPGNIYFLTADANGTMQVSFWVENTQDAYFSQGISAKSFQTQEIELKGNVIRTFNSNADLELRTNGTGAIFLDNISVNVNTIDTIDSTGITFTPAVTFNSDVDIENDLRVTNRVYAEEFVSTSTNVPEIYADTQLKIKVGTSEWTFYNTNDFEVSSGGFITAGGAGTGSILMRDETFDSAISVFPSGIVLTTNGNALSRNYFFNPDGGMQIPVLDAAPPTPTVNSYYVADGVFWDPATKSGSVAYPVFYDGVTYNALY